MNERSTESHSPDETASKNWWAELQSGPRTPEPGSNVSLLFIALSLGLVANWFLTSESSGPMLVKLFVLVGSVAICIAAVYSRRDTRILVMALVLIESQLAGAVGGIARSELHYGLLALFCIPWIAEIWRSNLWSSGGFRLYLIFLAWALLSMFWSLAPSFSFARWAGSFLAFCGITAISAALHNEEDFSRLVWKYIEACMVIVMIVTLSAIFLPHSVTWSEPSEYGMDAQLSRFQGILDNPNAVGALMLYTVAPILAFWPFFGRRKKLILSIVVTAALGMAALADSRSPFIALAVGSLLYTMWRYRIKGLLILAAAVLAMAAITPLLGGNLGDYIYGRDVGTLSGRTDIWNFAMQELRRHPIRGYGYEVAGAIFQSRYFPEWYGPWDDGPQSSLHNGYLTQAIGVGIPAKYSGYT